MNYFYLLLIDVFDDAYMFDGAIILLFDTYHVINRRLYFFYTDIRLSLFGDKCLFPDNDHA
ncbi:Hypothetical protein ETEE_2285 [Edwardsiella anguillarum ET080813]|uniref:Uncharacterized protein n=1 Tax=Edwardsiella anguillarum ET080813 TaxID=667120 RepID=A0A076LQ74_9GAMM|nr:Hypothetical protein ETEE_2285 [Edwardsiella anguillarum ET080813]